MKIATVSAPGGVGHGSTLQASAGNASAGWIVLGTVVVSVVVVAATLAYLLARLIVPRVDAENLPDAINAITGLVRAVASAGRHHRPQTDRHGEAGGKEH